ncbi:MAG TPA: SurA N-terminal domain-containing protein [candidate division Zixibacteria bacterium]|nr:SurA N-terminal domain-containing protein [candidate division Zixibacteria bacterium]
MAKKRIESTEDKQRQSRKEMLIARRHEQQTRRVWILVLAVVGLIAAVLILGIVNELVLKPSRPVAVVNEVEITLDEWRDQVEYRRALLVSRISDIADLVAGDVNQIQQIAGLELQTLGDPELLGQQVLDELIEQELVRQEAEARGISVSVDEVQASLEERFYYFGGDSPTPQPTPTETIMPTPSITPIAQEGLTETIQLLTPTPTPTTGPTVTPMPTPTAISLESFEESSGEWFNRLNDYGVDEALFRNEIEQDLYRERLIDALALEGELSDLAEHASIFYIRFGNEDEANDALEAIESSDYLTVWNTIRNAVVEEDGEDSAIAGELLWRTADNLESILGPDLSGEAFELDIDEPGSVIVVPAQTEDGADSFFIIMVSGREVRPLTESAFDNAKQQIYINWLDEALLSNVLRFERWRANIPQRPLLDTRSWIYPTPVPTLTPGDPLELIPQATPG